MSLSSTGRSKTTLYNNFTDWRCTGKLPEAALELIDEHLRGRVDRNEKALQAINFPTAAENAKRAKAKKSKTKKK